MQQNELINLIARSAASSGDLEQFLETLAGILQGAFPESRVCLLLRERDGGLALRACAGVEAPALDRLVDTRNSGIIAQALEARQNVAVNDAGSRPGWSAALENTGSELCVPLVSLGETLGAALFAHPRPNGYSAEDRALAQTACDVCALAIKNALLAEELRRATSTDSLTGAYNQRYFHVVVSQELARARRTQRPFALVLLDIRNFREVNQLLGPAGADRVLREVGRALASQASSQDSLFRYAGDQFALVLPGMDADRLRDLVARLHQGLQQVEARGEAGSLALSAVSASVLYPQDGATELELVRTLLARAQAAKK